MADIGDALAAALVPVAGWGPSHGAGHMDPAQAAEAIALLRPRVAVPIHRGTFLALGLGRRHAHILRDPPREFAAHVATRAPATRVAILAQGSSLTLGSLKPAESTPGDLPRTLDGRHKPPPTCSSRATRRGHDALGVL